mmetsp:Transcript_72009/g.154101  ORF Transcript_72009/g.154101 Transcript_72009/m.154101 type:complete len:809 (+) Transcript_72009:57-2483(+)
MGLGPEWGGGAAWRPAVPESTPGLGVRKVLTTPRINSLPPLPQCSVEEIAAAAQLPGKLRRIGGTGPWQQRPRHAVRNPALFRCAELEGGTSVAGMSRCSSQCGSLPPSVAGAAPVVEAPREKRRRSRCPHLRALKGLYLGGAPDAFADAVQAVDAVLDAGEEVAKVDLDDSEVRMQRELAQVRSGEDAITFFTKHGSNCEVKVLYCNRPPVSEPEAVGPYDLTIVPRERTHPEHFLISASGVVHVRPDQLSEFTPLAEWMHQALMYRVLSSMAFFRLHPQRKALSQWRASARHAAYCRRRQRFSRECFLAKPAFVQPLLQARGLLSEVAKVPLLKLPQRCCQLEDFVEMQESTCFDPETGAQRELEQKHEALVLTLEGLRKVVDEAVEAAPRWEAGPKDGRTRSKSMLQEKREAQGRARLEQLAGQDQARLGECVRLVEYMLQAALTAPLWTAALELRSRVEGCGGESHSRGMFTASVNLEEDGVAIDPPAESFVEAFTHLWAEPLNIVNSVPSLANARPLLGLGSDSGRRQTVTELITGDQSWADCTEGICATVARQFSEAMACAVEMYGPYLRIRQYGQAWCEASFVSKEHTHESLSEKMELMRAFQEDLAKFRPQRTVGILLLDGKGLRDDLSHIPETALTSMRQSLVALARDRCTTAYRRVDSVCKSLEERPLEPFAFESYTKTYHVAFEGQSSMEEMVDEVKDMHQLLRRYKVRVPIDDQSQLDMLHARHENLVEKTMLEARLFIERQQQRQEELLEQSAKGQQEHQEEQERQQQPEQQVQQLGVAFTVQVSLDDTAGFSLS